MAFAKRLLELRKQKGLSQLDLAQQIGVHKNVLGKYERDDVKPSIDIASKIADFFEVSLDYLTGKIDAEVDTDVLDKVLSIQHLPQKDREHILFTLEALIRDAKTRFAYS